MLGHFLKPHPVGERACMSCDSQLCLSVCAVQDVVAWITLGSLTIPHSDDVPTIQTAGSQMSFVLQPFNYFDSDPSEHVDDALNVLAATDTARLVYQRQGDLDDRGDIVKRDLDCLPVLVRKSAAAAGSGLSSIIIIIVIIIAMMMVDIYGRRQS